MIFNFPKVDCPFISSNISASPAFVSQLIGYARARSLYRNFVSRARLLTTKLLAQDYSKQRLISTLREFYGKYIDLVHMQSLCHSLFEIFLRLFSLSN